LQNEILLPDIFPKNHTLTNHHPRAREFILRVESNFCGASPPPLSQHSSIVQNTKSPHSIINTDAKHGHFPISRLLSCDAAPDPANQRKATDASKKEPSVAHAPTLGPHNSDHSIVVAQTTTPQTNNLSRTRLVTLIET
jgi:hypothetical protein